MVSKTERISVRVPENIHTLLSRAADALGSSMNTSSYFKLPLSAKQVVEDENIIRLSNESSRHLFLGTGESTGNQCQIIGCCSHASDIIECFRLKHWLNTSETNSIVAMNKTLQLAENIGPGS